MVSLLRQIDRPEAAKAAERELPDPVDIEQLKKFGERHGIDRDALVSGMGGSP